MGKKKNKEIPINIHALGSAPRGLNAVFEGDEGSYEHFPVILFAAVELDGSHDVCGLISADGGLFSPEDDEAFVGYWFTDRQTIDEFLTDHGRTPKE